MLVPHLSQGPIICTFKPHNDGSTYPDLEDKLKAAAQPQLIPNIGDPDFSISPKIKYCFFPTYHFTQWYLVCADLQLGDLWIFNSSENIFDCISKFIADLRNELRKVFHTGSFTVREFKVPQMT